MSMKFYLLSCSFIKFLFINFTVEQLIPNLQSNLCSGNLNDPHKRDAIEEFDGYIDNQEDELNKFKSEWVSDKFSVESFQGEGEVYRSIS